MNQKSNASNRKGIINPRSLENLKKGAQARNQGKIRMNFTLLPETVEWLKKQPNASETIDKLVKTVLDNEQKPDFSNIRETQRRNRGYVLTEKGLSKLKATIQENNVTQESLKELTGLDSKTVRKVLLCKTVNLHTIESCFEKLNLNLEDSDYLRVVQMNSDSNFVGRERAILELNDLVNNQHEKIILIQAMGGVGKTTLALKYFKTQNFDKVLKLWMAKETQNITSVEAVIEEWLRRDFNEEPGRDFNVTLDRLRQKLCDSNCKIGVLIDNIESALDEDNRFVKAHRRYVELLRVLVDPEVQSVTLITSRERLREEDVTIYHYRLNGLDISAWQQFFQNRQIQIDTDALVALHTAYNGNAKAMQILSGAITEEFQGNLASYWQENHKWIETDLENLVANQFNRLQQISPDAYNLLCRLGCYRYQDVASVPIEGLWCLLWEDIPEAKRRRVVKALQDRSLVDFNNGKYWLHPVVHAEAISRLRATQDWETANQKAAEFWTTSVKEIKTTEDVLKAFEAYHHYVQINAFEDAANVILMERNECLGRAFYLLGLFQPIIPAITLLIDKLNSGYHLCGLYNLLGIPSRSVGNTHQALIYHKQAQVKADDSLPSCKDIKESQYLENHKTEALINIGLCKIQLWELKEALSALDEADRIANPGWQLFILVCKAFINSCLEPQEKVIHLVNQLQEQESRISEYGQVILSQTFANIGKIDKSEEKCHKIMTVAKARDHTYVVGKVMNILAIIYRKRQSFTTAIEHHEEALKILDKVGAKCDLAETYYQLGLTYQEMRKTNKSRVEFKKAIQLFHEIEAPKQIERVNKSL